MREMADCIRPFLDSFESRACFCDYLARDFLPARLTEMGQLAV